MSSSEKDFFCIFRSMTGVGGRPEVNIEGSIDGVNWSEFRFKYKTDDIAKASVFVLPHQPRYLNS